MSDYWAGLMNYEGYQASKKMVGKEVSEQIQEDIRTFMLAFPKGYDDGKVKADAEYITDALCQIVVDNFNKTRK
jgi:hypothetical protein